MTALLSVRDAVGTDAEETAAIYNEGIAGRQATFETAPRDGAEMARRIAGTLPRHAFLVAEQGGAVLGWAATFPYSPRDVYAGIAEYSVYVAARVQHMGVGGALLAELLARAEASGLHKVTSRVFPENSASLALAARYGFRQVGTHLRHARLDGRWRDVVTVERLLPAADLP